MFLSACVLAMLPAAGAAESPSALAPTADGKLLFVAMKGETGAKVAPGYVLVWDLTKPELKAVVPGIPADVRAIQPTADGKRFVVAGGDRWTVNRIEVYDTATKKLLHTFDASAKYGSEAFLSPDGNWVAFRPVAEKAEPKVWSTQTGKRAEEVEKAIRKLEGSLAFTTDSKLAITSQQEFAEYDPATGKKTGGWKRAEPTETVYREYSLHGKVLPNGKGVVSVAPTGKRRQSYVIQVVTEKKDYFLGEVWDFASEATISPDGRLLLVIAGSPRDGGSTYALKLDADGAPEMIERKEDDKSLFWVRGFGEKKAPAWREWSFAEGNRGDGGRGRFDRALPERDLPGSMAFSPDGKRLFVVIQNRLQVHDTERRVSKATLFAAKPTKDDVPEWHILTAAGEFVASPAEAESLAKAGKAKDVAKVKDALGVK